MSKSKLPRLCFLLFACAFLFVGAFAADGDLDTTFNSNGYRQISFGDSAEEGRAVKVQPDGKLLS